MSKSPLLAALFALAPAFLAAQFGPPPAKPTGPWMNTSLSPDERAALLVKQLTFEEKISLVHGTGWEAIFGELPKHSVGGAGFVPGIPRLGIPDLQMADAAVGVARGAVYGRYSTPLPSAVAEAASWDLRVAREYGALIGSELHAQGYNMGLGGGVNLTREPRNGRNFEYQGEDPILAGKMAGAAMKGLAEQGVIPHIKHYAINDQENGRNFVNINIDKRAMRETDLLAFEIGIKEGGVGAVMCSYNMVNGVYACENDYLLNQVLKKQWGFQGFVVSDWGGTHSAAKAAQAGLDMEQPGADFYGKELKKEVDSGTVPAARLDNMVQRILRTEFVAGLFDRPADRQAVNVIKGLDVAQHVAERSSVLLKNSAGQLPLANSVRSIAVIGSHADVGVMSGGGSAQVDPPGGNAVPDAGQAVFGPIVWQPSSPLKAIRARAPKAKVEYNSGDDAAAAARLAKASDVAIVFVNQPSSEGADMATLSLPGKQDELVSAVAAANPHTIVVLETGGPVTMPWIANVNAALEVWFPGIRGGEAIANILFGDVNPSARLPLTFPKSEQDLPRPKLAEQPAAGPNDMVPFIPGTDFKMNSRKFDVSYDEGLKVGYKWYESEKKAPLFPFGFGLSYTTFTYSDFKASVDSVTFTVRNSGPRAGEETPQVYVTLPSAAGEPFHRLVTWEKIALAPGEAKTLTLHLDPHYLSIFNATSEKWELVAGTYTLSAGGSSADLPLHATVQIAGN